MQIVLILHNALRWAVLIFGLLAVIKGVAGLINRRQYEIRDDKMGLLFMIFCDIQLLIGLGLYFSNSWFTQLKENGAAVMKDATARFFTVEHALMMIIAWLLVHIGRANIKKSVPSKRAGKMLLFYGIALLIILASIPWAFREAVARPFVRWFN